MCDRVVSEALAASRGIVAGATAATYELRAFLARAIRSHTAIHRSVRLTVYIDDIGQDVVAASAREAASLMAASAADLAAILESTLGLPIGDSESAVLGSNVAVEYCCCSIGPSWQGKICWCPRPWCGLFVWSSPVHNSVICLVQATNKCP